MLRLVAQHHTRHTKPFSLIFVQSVFQIPCALIRTLMENSFFFLFNVLLHIRRNQYPVMHSLGLKQVVLTFSGVTENHFYFIFRAGSTTLSGKELELLMLHMP